MFKSLRELSATLQRLVEGVEAVAAHLSALLAVWSTQGTLEARLEALEGSRQHWEAVQEANELRVESRFKAARSAEERARTMANHARTLAGDENGEEDGQLERAIELLRPHVEPGGEEAVPDVPEILALDPKAHARRAKWGV